MTPYRPHTQPYAHQVAAAAHRDRRPRRPARSDVFAYLMEMGCVDADTEYLSRTGWCRIADYTKGEVAQFCLDGTAEFVEPLGFTKKLCDSFYHFSTSRGVDQMLSPGHRILYCGREQSHIGHCVGQVPDGFRNKPKQYTECWREAKPEELAGNRRKIHCPTHFYLNNKRKLNLTDAQLRLQVAFFADGSFHTRDVTKFTRQGCMRIRHEYKKVRLRTLLHDAGVIFKERTATPTGFSVFNFYPPLPAKTFSPAWWQCSEQQRLVVCDEVWQWDGCQTKTNGWSYSSMHKSDADFVQWCFVSTGHRASMHLRVDGVWGVHATGDGRTSNLAMMYAPRLTSTPGAHMYCFSVPSGYLVLRRNGRVFVTGNTGKSKCLLDEWGERAAACDLRDLLIIAPAGSYRNWDEDKSESQPSQLRAHLDPALLERTLVAPWVSGMGVEARRHFGWVLGNTDTGQARVMVMNVEALSTVARAREAVREFLRPGQAMVAMDESTRIKNPSAKRTQHVIGLCHRAAARRVLSGLPTPRSPLDLYSQFEFLDWLILGHQSYWTFRQRYAVMEEVKFGGGYNAFTGEEAEGKKVKIVVGYRNEEELRQRIAPYSFRALKEDCLDLPPKVYETRDVALTAEQRRIYKELKELATAELESGDHVTATQVIVRMMRLHQVVCGHVTDEGGTVHDIPSNRIDELMQVLEEHGGKSIIWVNYEQALLKIVDAIKKEYGPKSAAAFWGGNRARRGEEERRFLGDPECRFMVSTQSAGGMGNTWVAADLVVYYSNNYDLEHRMQSEDRAHRAGQTRRVTYVDLVARGTVDEKIIRALREKINMASAITGDGWRRWLV